MEIDRRSGWWSAICLRLGNVEGNVVSGRSCGSTSIRILCTGDPCASRVSQQSQGWSICCSENRTELQDEDGSLLANVEMVNNVYILKRKLDVVHLEPALAAWIVEGSKAEPTHDELVERLGRVVMVATAKGADGRRALLVIRRSRPWSHRQREVSVV